GQPVADAVVDEWTSFSWRRERLGLRVANSRYPETPHRTKTGQDGRFALEHLTPGEIGLRVTHPEYAPLELMKVEIPAEGPVEDVVLQLEKGTLFTGWVKGLDGEMRSDVSVALQYGNRVYRARTDYTGRFRIEHVASGKYMFSVSLFDATLPMLTFEGEEKKEYNVDFTKAGTITGKLELPASVPDGFSFRIEMYGVGDMQGGGRRADIDEDGSFEFRGVFAGTYRLTPNPRNTRPDRDRHTLKCTTSPAEVLVTVTEKGAVTQDVTVTALEESTN
ncbi:MAG TPA: carboxypeptidase-like regulatory domain-containing protein, partial [Planctomycetota bacterium]|nr:carboxypeptidase-like regulatory domain-containing protein [Planctomycetota bacterium]